MRTLNALGRAALLQGDAAAAREAYTESLALGREMGAQADIFRSLLGLADVAWQQGDIQGAAAAFREALERADQRAIDVADIIWCLRGVGQVAAARGNGERAARLLGAAEALAHGSGVQLDRAEQGVLARLPGSTQVAEARWASSWAEGQAMTLEDAIAYALEDDTTAD